MYKKKEPWPSRGPLYDLGISTQNYFTRSGIHVEKHSFFYWKQSVECLCLQTEITLLHHHKTLTSSAFQMMEFIGKIHNSFKEKSLLQQTREHVLHPRIESSVGLNNKSLNSGCWIWLCRWQASGKWQPQL